MLTYLSIKNVSVIENINLELESGLTVLTGETGSGKSVLLSALKLLLGERFNKFMLRSGSDKLSVEGIFTNINVPELYKELFDIEDEIIISRQVDIGGKNRITINGKLATVGQLKELSFFLADIHGQHEHQSLLDPTNHLKFVDHLVAPQYLEEFHESYKKYILEKSAYEKALEESRELIKHREDIEFRINEIESMAIDINDDNTLEEKISLLSNIEKIREASTSSIQLLSEGDINALDLIHKSIRYMDGAAHVMPDFNEMAALLSDCSEKIQGIIYTLSSLETMQEVTPQELDNIINRKYKLDNLIRKYSLDDGSLDGVLNSLNDLKRKYLMIEDNENYIKDLHNKLHLAVEDVKITSKKLFLERKKSAERISKEIIRILKDLDLDKSKFEIRFTDKGEIDSKGGVDAEFFISINQGFDPAPLSKIASGGEISRVMLALKEVFSDADAIDTLFFDEIDTGVSGKTAKKLSEKLVSLASKKQIIVITHIPVVAASGASHFHVTKDIKSGVTQTNIASLNHNDRAEVIAAMLAGEVTKLSLKQANELLTRI